MVKHQRTQRLVHVSRISLLEVRCFISPLALLFSFTDAHNIPKPCRSVCGVCLSCLGRFTHTAPLDRVGQRLFVSSAPILLQTALTFLNSAALLIVLLFFIDIFMLTPCLNSSLCLIAVIISLEFAPVLPKPDTYIISSITGAKSGTVLLRL